MYFLYSFALSVLFIVLLPYFIYQAFKHGKYTGNFRERLGRLPDGIRGGERPTIWMHAVSVGEFNAARPLIERLKQEFSGHRIIVSTTTLTGQRLARSQASGNFDAVFYFPFDWAFAVRRALTHLSPAAVIILETELWPNFLRECRRRRVATLIVNGRISPRSFSRYLKARAFIARVMQDTSLLIMQSDQDAQRARSLGANSERVQVCGNLKYEISESSSETTNATHLCEELDRQFALSSSTHIIVAGSTAPGEERILLDALREARKHKGLEECRLIIAPRHPERFDEAASLIAQSGFKLARRSEAHVMPAAQSEGRLAFETEAVLKAKERLRAADVILLDSVGELAAIYRFATVVFVGGSLVERGGHNIIEPAVYAKPIIIGPYTENFRQIVSDFACAEAVVQVSETGAGLASSFTREVIRLLSDTERAKAMGGRAQNILVKNRGATDCTIAAIKKVLSDYQ